MSARDAFQVCELADQKGLRYSKVGRHYGKNKLVKAPRVVLPRLPACPPSRCARNPHIALSHGARSQIIISNLLRIPTVLMADYEFAQYLPLMTEPTWEMAPEVIPAERSVALRTGFANIPASRRTFSVGRAAPRSAFADGAGPRHRRNMLITVRPPATEAHYHNPESEELFVQFMRHVRGRKECASCCCRATHARER